jgi:malonate-semialdehyde dehydrogenase (acetylating) / methylmalonate-semialdehyde dehydrogenase
MNNGPTTTATATTRIDNYIAGSQSPPFSGEYLDVVNPATFQVVGRVAISNTRDVQEAVAAAEAAFPAWSSKTIKARAAMVRYNWHDGKEEERGDHRQKQIADPLANTTTTTFIMFV